ncbi:MAG: heparinase II/III family protein [Clostridia bacterium]|nr:heparinase II/III family protein [Clostridia bacterium]
MRKKILDAAIAHSGGKQHPRIMMSEADFARIPTSADPIDIYAMKKFVKDADALLEKELLKYEIPDGIRLLSVSRAMLDRTFRLGLAYRTTGDRRYADRLWREMENVASFKDWNPYHFLDVGEMTNAMGIAFDWLYDYLDEEQKQIVVKAIIEKGVNAAMDDYLNRERKRSYRWYQDMPGDNWKFVCNGGITVGILAIFDEPNVDQELLRDALNYAYINTYEAVRIMYHPDGSYEEGFTYWTYATSYLGFYVMSLISATGTDFGLADYEPVHKSPYYVKALCSNNFYCFNFGDAQEVLLCSDVYLWLGRYFNDPVVSNMRISMFRQDEKHIGPRDMLHYRPTEEKGMDSVPLDAGSVGGTNASFRSGWTDQDLYGAIHFGDNNAYHRHEDMGTFCVEYKHRRFFCDLGQDNYNVKKYAHCYRFRAEGHNTICINLSPEPIQERYCECYIDRFRMGTDTEDAIAVCDMTPAYFGKSAVRGMRMTKDRTALIVQDDLSLAPEDTVWWFGHTKADIELAADRKSAILTIDGVRLWVGLLTEGEFEIMPAELLFPEMKQADANDNSKVRKLALHLGGETKCISVAFMPLEDGETAPKNIPTVKPIAEW